MFSPAALYVMPFSLRTVKQLVPFGRVCEKLTAISCARIADADKRLLLPLLRADTPTFARSSFTSRTSSLIHCSVVSAEDDVVVAVVVGAAVVAVVVGAAVVEVVVALAVVEGTAVVVVLVVVGVAVVVGTAVVEVVVTGAVVAEVVVGVKVDGEVVAEDPVVVVTVVAEEAVVVGSIVVVAATVVVNVADVSDAFEGFVGLIPPAASANSTDLERSLMAASSLWSVSAPERVVIAPAIGDIQPERLMAIPNVKARIHNVYLGECFMQPPTNERVVSAMMALRHCNRETDV